MTPCGTAALGCDWPKADDSCDGAKDFDLSVEHDSTELVEVSPGRLCHKSSVTSPEWTWRMCRVAFHSGENCPGHPACRPNPRRGGTVYHRSGGRPGWP